MNNVTKGLSKRNGKKTGFLNIILNVQTVVYTVLALALPSLVNAAVFNIPGGDVGALIAAINEANNNFEDDNIVLEAGIYTLTATLPVITSVVTFSVVDGVGKARIERAASAPSFRIFEIASTGSVALISIDIVGGNASAAGGVRNEGLLILAACTVSNNTATFSDGGGITNIGTLIIGNCTISDNQSSRDGAGILNVGSMIIFNSTISHNSAAVNGGGLENASDTSGNFGTMFLNNVTITNNRADADSSGGGNGGGISNCPSCTARLKNTIIAGNFDSNIVPQAPDCSGTLTSEGFNLMGDSANCNFIATTGDRVGISDPRLGILRDNGGPTSTHALLSPPFGGPAIDTGNPAVPGSGGNACEFIDQRGFKRPVDGDSNGTATCDIGAFEVGAEPPVVNNLVSFAPLASTFSTTAAANGCPANFVGKFNFVATITNDSSSPSFSELVVQIETLTNGNVLLNADAGPAVGGFGATLTVPRRDGFSDGILGPGEFVDIPFVICLRNTAPFTFLVSVSGAQ